MNKPKLKAIVATSPEGIIAIDGKMPWKVREDLRRFRRLTLNNVVIYGRKTFESLNSKPFDNRVNFMVSTKGHIDSIINKPIVTYCDLDAAVSDASILYPDKEIWICGGASVYKQMLPIVEVLELTIIKKDQVCYHEGEQLFFPYTKDQILDWFKLEREEETKKAIYQTYKRRASNISNKVTSHFP